MATETDRGFRKIGNLAKPIANSRRHSDSTPTRSPTPSAIIGTPKPGKAVARSIGPQHGGTGAALTPTSERARRVVAFLDLPEAAASLVPSVDSTLILRPRNAIGSDGQFDRLVIDRVDVRDGADPRELAGLRIAFEKLCEPMGAQAATAALTQLATVTVRRQHGFEDDAMAAAAYATLLAEYPPDVAQGACKAWARQEKFWPAWAELQAQCDRLMAGRSAIRHALRKIAL